MGQINITVGKYKVPAIYILLTIATVVAFRQVTECDFITMDDHSYVTENSHIANGISWEAIRWAFATGHATNWHPLTWVSHMLDVQLFGLNPHLHHLTNLLFHIVNSLLLFLVFRRMTGEDWKSAFVAALFAFHPLHVESVAWVAERKDVLSTFFLFSTLAMYAFYADRPFLIRYLAVILFFAFGLMSKPMLVTLPFVLLLLDYWPLQRLDPEKHGHGDTGRDKTENRERGLLSATEKKRKRITKPTGPPVSATRVAASPLPRFPVSVLIRPLILEKIPLFVLSALSCIITYMVQQRGGAVTPLEALPVGVRIANALVSYVAYVRKTFFPHDLAVFYPYPLNLPAWQVLGAALLLGAVTFAVLRLGKRYPFLPVGWLWFAGMLVPVLGIVQVGLQAMADRYTYIPLIGLFIMAAWGIPELLRKWRFRREAVSVFSVIVILCLVVASHRQVGYWKDSITLFDHALEVGGPSGTVYYARGCAYSMLGLYRREIEDYDRAIRINPGRWELYYNRGIAYWELGDQTRAIENFNMVIATDPGNAEGYMSRGLAYGKLGDQRQAIADYDKAIEINPEGSEIYNSRGTAYWQLGDRMRGISDFDAAIRIDPKNANAYISRGVAYEELGDYSRAVSDFSRAIEFNPDRVEAYCDRGDAYEKLGDYRRAILDYDRAVELDRGYAKAYFNRAVALGKLGDRTRAVEDLKRAAGLGYERAGELLAPEGTPW
jgi:tetratricopeptide (TPR) repeat protein